MTWTYSGDPSSTDRDEVRFLVGDTDTNNQLVTDEEIAYAITTEGSNLSAASRVAQTIAAQFARRTDEEVGDLKKWYSQRYAQYMSLSKSLGKRGTIATATPYAGGISVDDKDTQKDDTDRVAPRFSRGQFTTEGNVENSERLSADC